MAKILLLEDDASLRQMLGISLQEMGHTVVAASSGEEASVLQEQEGADVLLTDILMPHKEGLEIIMEFRREWPQVAIVAMSGGGRMSGGHYLHMAKGLGASAVLDKPFSNEALAAAIQSALRSR